MGSERLRRAQGEDLVGKTITSRTAGINTDMLSPLERGMIVKQMGKDLKGVKVEPPKRGAEPMEDPDATGGKVANVNDYSDAGFKVYTEKKGGRAGMGGKRGAE